MQGRDSLKLARLKAALSAGEADLAAGRVTAISSDADLDEFFDRLLDSKIQPLTLGQK